MKPLLLTLFLLTTIPFGFSQGLTSSQIDELAQRTMQAFKVPGISVGVVKDGKVVHAQGYGVRSLNSGEKTDAHTRFGIASNTKAFTATALGLLVDAGKLNWDDKVQDYIPEFKLYNPYVTEEFTIRDLLTHRSGLGLGAGDLMLWPDSNNFTLKDIIYNLRHLKPTSSFRSKYDYDNNLYIVAGEVVARVSGKSWDAFVEERILQPLGMTESAATYERLKDLGNVIDGHAVVDGKVRVIQRHRSEVDHAAASIYASVADLNKWVLLQLNRGQYGNGQRLFSEAVSKELWTPQTLVPVRSPGPYNTQFAAYGLGFHITDVKGYKQLHHTGGLEGMVTQITMIPELNLGIIVLTNQQEGGAFRAITDQIKDGYLQLTGTDRVAQYAKTRQESLAKAGNVTDAIWKHVATVQKQQKKNPDYSAYLGTYRDPWLGEVVISRKNGLLWFEAKRSPKLSGQMFAYKGTSFVVKWKERSMDADAFVNFALDTEGRATGMTMKPISPLTDFSYDFQDLNFTRLPDAKQGL
ncbi:serine hydrolase [Rufibacter glacialis]|uniref:Serine hydrolase n=1 Tax=Rufibacter glacialis TaxID=1259555 RepID=A0A5M8QRV7_9BACT|nr:serine hydrolase [Rufibacter glacialis]KAA6437780.1 serine hydrolase [Rufibacter glacialis]GGK56325.1 serine hydrolase [Rufibacter glacialis]